MTREKGYAYSTIARVCEVTTRSGFPILMLGKRIFLYLHIVQNIIKNECELSPKVTVWAS